MTDITRQEFNDILHRMNHTERASDKQVEYFKRIEDHLENTDANVSTLTLEVKEFRHLLQSQGIRLAILFSGITVVVMGFGFLVTITTLIKNIQEVAKP